MYDDKTSESHLILAAYQEICPMEVYVLTPYLYLVKLPVSIVFAFPVHFIVLEVECFRQTNCLLPAVVSLVGHTMFHLVAYKKRCLG